ATCRAPSSPTPRPGSCAARATRGRSRSTRAARPPDRRAARRRLPQPRPGARLLHPRRRDVRAPQPVRAARGRAGRRPGLPRRGLIFLHGPPGAGTILSSLHRPPAPARRASPPVIPPSPGESRMKKPLLLLGLLALAAAGGPARADGSPAADVEFFEKKVRPL